MFMPQVHRSTQGPKVCRIPWIWSYRELWAPRHGCWKPNYSPLKSSMHNSQLSHLFRPPSPCLTLRSYLFKCTAESSKVSISLLTVLRKNAHLQLVQAFHNTHMDVDADSSPLIWTIGILCRSLKTWLMKSKFKKTNEFNWRYHPPDRSEPAFHGIPDYPHLKHQPRVPILPANDRIFFSIVSYSGLSMMQVEISLLFPNQRLLRDIFFQALKVVLLSPTNGWKNIRMKCSQAGSLRKDFLATVLKIALEIYFIQAVI